MSARTAAKRFVLIVGVREKSASSMEQTRAAVGGNDGYGLVRRSYFRVARWSRLARIAFWICFVVFLFWALPVFPWGMSLADYSPKVVLALFLLGVCPAVAAIYLLAASAAARHREALVAWSSIYDEATGLRNREFFIERLELQCHLGKDLAEYRVAIILVTIEEQTEDGQKLHAPDDQVFRRFGTHLLNQMRPSDLVAAISGTEMGILTAAGSTYALSSIVCRLQRSLEARLAQLGGAAAPRLLVRMGYASLTSIDPEPEALMEAARNDLKPVFSGQKEPTAA